MEKGFCFRFFSLCFVRQPFARERSPQKRPLALEEEEGQEQYQVEVVEEVQDVVGEAVQEQHREEAQKGPLDLTMPETRMEVNV